ncbi:zinc finger protein [Ascosphaera apis ARSEF 7405]|uniref:Zinc finger protein n=1 Tax=Ascosphaera apis ARSEF 7405 TaxID=392613 RepID=A0A167YMR1_9EURO|nr:zinc finger protein [Ascosphaera apis ARSEF 7405]
MGESSREPSAQPSQTAQDFLDEQLRLEADAREALPWSFDTCSKPLGPLKQSIFSCLTCNPPPPSTDKELLLSNYTPAGICYSCSISCHGDHHLAELFTKRDFECDCGTTRITSSTPCSLRINPVSGQKGDVRGEKARDGNKYNQNFRNRFCGCGEEYNPDEEKGIMFQCLGLGECGEDWWHPECLLGIPRSVAEKKEDKAADTAPGNKEDNETSQTEKGEEKAVEKDVHDTTQPPETENHGEQDNGGDDNDDDDDEIPLPEGFPAEDDFESLICYKCVEANPWIKAYAGTPGFLPPVYKKDVMTPEDITNTKNGEREEPTTAQSPLSKKRKHGEVEDPISRDQEDKRTKEETKIEAPSDSPVPPDENGNTSTTSQHAPPPRLHESLPPNPPSGTFSLFLKEDFRDHLCHCPTCFPSLAPYPHLLAEEEIYQPPSDSRSASPDPSLNGRTGTSSVHSGRNSIYDRGEAALNTMDRVKALEGVMIYQHLRDKVKEFLRPYAETGEAVGAEDVREYFARLRGDDQGGRGNSGGNEDNGGQGGDGRREQSGEF